MSVVVQLGDYRNKETLTLLRELLIKASDGEIVAFGFNVEFKDGTQKTGFSGKYKVDPVEALRVANRMSTRLNAIQDLRDAALLTGACDAIAGDTVTAGPGRLRN